MITPNSWENISPIEPTPVKVLHTVNEATSQLKVAVITPTKNEISGIEDFIARAEQQTYPIYQHILIDAFSHDGTFEALTNYVNRNPRFAVLQSHLKPGAARNLAWSQILDEVEVLVFMDAGCLYEPRFIESLVATICTTNSNIAYVPNSIRLSKKNSALIPTEDYKIFSQQDWNSWLPPIRGVAIKNPKAVKARFPDWVNFAGDDTLFDIHLKNELRTSSVFMGRFPLVTWIPPNSESEVKEMYKAYFYGDGETGARDWLGGAPDVYELSYMAGRASRANLDKKRGVSKLYFLFSKFSPGSESSKNNLLGLATQLTSTGYRVIFASLAQGALRESPTWFSGDISLFTNCNIQDQNFLPDARNHIEGADEITILTDEISHKMLKSIFLLTRLRHDRNINVKLQNFDSHKPSLKSMYFSLWNWLIVVTAHKSRNLSKE